MKCEDLLQLYEGHELTTSQQAAVVAAAAARADLTWMTAIFEDPRAFDQWLDAEIVRTNVSHLLPQSPVLSGTLVRVSHAGVSIDLLVLLDLT